MSSIDHIHTEAEMLKVREHSELLSAQYVTRCLEPGNVCHPITTRAIPERQMKETLYTRPGSDWPGGKGGVPPQAPCLIKFIRIDIDLYIR